MRHRIARALALGLASGLLALATSPASAADEPADAGHAVGHASSAAVLLRLLPGSVPQSSILPGLARLTSGHYPFEAGYGLATAQLNTNAALPYERSIAQATPEGSLFGAVETPTGGSLIQTAAPDNAKPATERLSAPLTPAAPLVSTGDTTAEVHARWSEDAGPCVGTASRASTDTESLTIGKAIPTLPDMALDDLLLPEGARAARFQPDGGLGSLGGLLSDSALVHVPDGFTGTSTVSVADSAVRSTSTVDTTTIDILPGSPLGMTATVGRPPTLSVTATGDDSTSRVGFEPPTITVTRGGTTLFTLDDEHPTQDVPIGVPKPALYQATGKTELAPVPIVAGAAQTATGARLTLTGPAQRAVTDLFVLRLSVGGLNQTSDETSYPIEGTEFAASARLLDVQLLPTRALADALARLPYQVTSSLAQYSLGELTAGALVAAGGVECDAVPTDAAQAGNAIPSSLGTPSPGAASVPLLWAGALALLVGVALVTVPFRSPRRTPPSPVPRE
ncbi:MAG: hypothetical protein GEV00_17525 [Actinophytocola sp.]|nr:hypothetical protein [Actinophytocola sp.]